MSLLKKLQIGDNNSGRYTKEYLLVDYKCYTFRRHNEYRPDTEKYCDKIELTVIAPGKEDMMLYEWFVEQSFLSGRILIELSPLSSQTAGEVRSILFEEGTCFSFEEDYHIGVNQRRMLKLSFVAEEVNIDGVIFVRHL